MEYDYLALVTVIVTFILGLIAKKIPWFKNNLIPVQNLIIGIVMAVIYWIISKDFSVAIALSGLAAGGTYDFFKNLLLITKSKDESVNDEQNEEGK